MSTRKNGRGGSANSNHFEEDAGTGVMDADQLNSIQQFINASLKGHQETIMGFLRMNLEMVNKKVDAIMVDVADLKKSREFAEGYSVDIQRIEGEIKRLNVEIQTLNKQPIPAKIEKSSVLDDGFQKQLDDIKKRIIDQEDRSRRNNLRIDGIEEDEEEETWEVTKAKVEEFIKEKFDKEDVKLERVHRTGKKTPGSTRTIVAQFNSWTEKDEILGRASILRNSGVSLYEDFCAETVAIRKSLVSQMKKARAAGQYARTVYNKLETRDRKNKK